MPPVQSFHTQMLLTRSCGLLLLFSVAAFAQANSELRRLSPTKPLIPASYDRPDLKLLEAPPDQVLAVARRGGAPAHWRSRYELGPGDVLNIGLYGRPELAREAVAVGPDAKISFLQAKQISVRGLTIEELRTLLADHLAMFYRNPRVLVTPVVLGSKRFTILGEVARNGVYVLDRPTTLLEAVAQAGGFRQTNSSDEIPSRVDYRNSFLNRRGTNLPVDFAGLFLRGEFKHNVQIHPGDYIYLASYVGKEVFVIGRVNKPGPYELQPGMTVLGAISQAGGFAVSAWKNRVLLVRGRLDNPRLHVIEAGKAVKGRNSDVEVQSGDLLYVSTRPWAYATQVLDAALAAYIDSSVNGLLVEDDSGVGFTVGPGL